MWVQSRGVYLAEYTRSKHQPGQLLRDERLILGTDTVRGAELLSDRLRRLAMVQLDRVVRAVELWGAGARASVTQCGARMLTTPGLPIGTEQIAAAYASATHRAAKTTVFLISMLRL